MDRQQIANLLKIQQSSRANKLVVFVGAGVSLNSGIPTWNKLIDSMKKELPSELAKETDVLKIAQMYKDSRGDKEYMDKIKEVLLYNKAVPNPLHKSILSLNPCHIITTNYDDLIEQEISNEFLQYDIIREDKDIPQMENPNSLIKMHGDYLTDNIVLTEKDYYDYKDNFPLIRSYVQSLFASKLVLFVGFSFADLNLKMILNELQNILSENMQRAYLLSCEEPNYTTRQYFEKKGINILYFSEKDVDEIIGLAYSENQLSGIGKHTDKLLHAINHYSSTSKKDLAQYLYNRILPYRDELRSFGDGLRYFFPKEEGLYWNTHSKGLQTGLEYFKSLAHKLKTKQAKRQFLIEHPSMNIRTLLKTAYYNYLFEIDGLEILDNKFFENIDKYINQPVLFYIHRFDYEKVCQILKKLRTRPIRYCIDDLELPYTLYVLGDYMEAYQQYVKLLSLYWNRQKYILYFICRYNLWAIRNGVYSQLMLNNEYDVDKEIELATEKDLEEILGKLPLDFEIKKIFQDLISFRSIGEHAITIENLKEEIFKQRKLAENGGYSINSNIVKLLSLYERENMFSWANCIISDNNAYYRSISENNALGILNSFATPSTTMFGGIAVNTKIKSLNDSMLESMIFDLDCKRLKEIFKRYEIASLKLSKDGVNFINTCLNGLLSKHFNLFRQESILYNYLNNLLLFISKSKEETICVDNLYKVLIKYLSKSNYGQIDCVIIYYIIINYVPQKEIAQELLFKLLSITSERQQYIQCVYRLVQYLKENKVIIDNFDYNWFSNKDYIATEIGFVYQILSNQVKDTILNFCVENINDLYDYCYFIYKNKIEKFSAQRFKYLLEKGNEKLTDEDVCKMLAKIRRCEIYQELYTDIDNIALSNECLRFLVSPLDFNLPDKVQVEWILRLDDEEKKEIFAIPLYKEKLKSYISESTKNVVKINNLIEYL